VLEGVRELATAGMVPGGSRRNLEWVRPRLDAAGGDEIDMAILADAQTSGGLLFGAEPAAAEAAAATLSDMGYACAVVGRAEGGSGVIRLRP
jgi:selenide,water dikinase